jgi:hypothetical protein
MLKNSTQIQQHEKHRGVEREPIGQLALRLLHALREFDHPWQIARLLNQRQISQDGWHIALRL